MSGRTTIVQVEQLVEPGEIDPGAVHLPGVFVQRVVHTGPQDTRIEKRTIATGEQR
jgi:3-oxoacid CoA-transferase subunit A